MIEVAFRKSGPRRRGSNYWRAAAFKLLVSKALEFVS
jgi:hypothetical protein